MGSFWGTPIFGDYHMPHGTITSLSVCTPNRSSPDDASNPKTCHTVKGLGSQGLSVWGLQAFRA